MKKLFNQQSALIVGVIFSVMATLVVAKGVASTGHYTNKKTTSTAVDQTTQPKKLNGGSSIDEAPVFGFGVYGTTGLNTFWGDIKYATYLGYNHSNALALELAGGPRLFRTNNTYGLALTDHQRIKLTYEWLAEKRKFSFVTQDETQWVSQNAIGGDYAYFFENAYIESIGFGGYYAHSASYSLDDGVKLIPEQDLKITEQRRIAGANAGNMHVDLGLRLWPHSRLTGGVDYDVIHFDTKYDKHDDAKNVNGVGGHFKLEQRLLPQIKATTQIRLQQNQREYAGSLGWLMPSPKGSQLELQVISDYVDSLAIHRHYFTNGLRLNVAFADSNRTYDDLDKQQTLLSWTRQPSVRMANVLAVADSHVTKTSISGDGDHTDHKDPEYVPSAPSGPDDPNWECDSEGDCLARNAEGWDFTGGNQEFVSSFNDGAPVTLGEIRYVQDGNHVTAEYTSAGDFISLTSEDGLQADIDNDNWDLVSGTYVCHSNNNPNNCPLIVVE